MLFRRILSAFICFTFLATTLCPPASAQTVFNLPLPGTAVLLSQPFSPPMVRGITFYPDHPLKFDFVIDGGDEHLQGETFQKESMKLIKYFLASLTVPETDMWVNLSPYEKDRIVPEQFGQTEMGRDLLLQDYLLKQLTASLLSPDEQSGKMFWERVRQEALAKGYTNDISADTFHKIWIMPDVAKVYVHQQSVYVAESHLKVMLEEDYLARQHTAHPQDTEESDKQSALTKQLMREIIIPAIEREVNEGRNFALLRQIQHSAILAAWYKKNLKQTLLAKVYVDHKKMDGINENDKNAVQDIYDQYLKAFKNGVYDLIKEDYDPALQEVVSRKYFSGGVIQANAEILTSISAGDSALLGQTLLTQFKEPVNRVTCELGNQDPAMISIPVETSPFIFDLEIGPKTLTIAGTEWNEAEHTLFNQPIDDQTSIVAWRQYVSRNINVGLSYQGQKIPFVQLEIPFNSVTDIYPLLPAEYIKWFLGFLNEHSAAPKTTQFLRNILDPFLTSVEKKIFLQSSEESNLTKWIGDIRQHMIWIHALDKTGNILTKGTGTVIQIDQDFYVLTADHVIGAGYTFEMITQDGRKLRTGNKFWNDGNSDVAIILLDPSTVQDLKAFPLKKVPFMGEGPVLFAGFAAHDLDHFENAILWGWAEKRNKGTLRNPQSNTALISISTTRKQGMSGGPVFDLISRSIIGVISGGGSNDTESPFSDEETLQSLIKRPFKKFTNIDTAMMSEAKVKETFDREIAPLFYGSLASWDAWPESLKRILLKKGISQDLIDVIKNGNDTTKREFIQTFSLFIDEMGEEFVVEKWDEIISLAKGTTIGFSRDISPNDLFTSLIELKETFGPAFVKTYWPELMEAANLHRSYAAAVFTGLSLMKSFILTHKDEEHIRQNIKKYGAGLSDISTHTARDALTFYELYFSSFVSAYGKNFVQTHWEDIVALARSVSQFNTNELFSETLPTFRRKYGKDFVEAHWEEVMRFARYNKKSKDKISNINFGIENIIEGLNDLADLLGKDFIKQPKVWRATIKMLIPLRYNTTRGKVLSKSIPKLLEELDDDAEFLRSHWNSFVKMTMASGEKADEMLFEFGTLKIYYGSSFMKRFWKDLVKMTAASKGEAKYFLDMLSHVESYTDSGGKDGYLMDHWDTVREICLKAGPNAGIFLRFGLTELKGLIFDPGNHEETERRIKLTAETFFELMDSLPKKQQTQDIFYTMFYVLKGLTNAKSLEETLGNIRRYGQSFVQMEIARHKVGDSYSRTFEYFSKTFGLPFVREYWDLIVKTQMEAGKHDSSVFHYLAEFKSWIIAENPETTRENFIHYAKDFLLILQAREDFDYGHNMQFSENLTKHVSKAFLKKHWNEIVPLLVSLKDMSAEEIGGGILKTLEMHNATKSEKAPYLFKEIRDIINLTTEYNRERIIRLIFDKDYLAHLNAGDKRLISHLKFYKYILTHYPTLGFSLLEGLTQGFQGGIMSWNLTLSEKKRIIRFIDRMHSFHPLLYKLYKTKGPSALTSLKIFAQNILTDQIGEKEIKAFLRSKDLKKFNDDEKMEILTAAIQIAIPTTGTSFVKREETVDLLKKFMEEGDLRGHVPTALRNKNFGEGLDPLSVSVWKAKQGSVIDQKKELKQIVKRLRGGGEDEKKERKALEKSIKDWFKDFENDYLKKKVLAALYQYAGNYDVINHILDSFEDTGDYPSILFLEQIFVDKHYLVEVLEDVFKKIPEDAYPQVQRKRVKLHNKDNVIRHLKRRWNMNEISLEQKRRMVHGLLGNVNIKDLEKDVIPFIEEESLITAIRELAGTDLGRKPVMKSIIFERLLKDPISLIRQERAKFEYIESDRTLTLDFRVVKGMPHGLWGLNCGVCIATDIELWKDKKFSLLQIVDQKAEHVVGYVHLFEETIDGEKVLFLPGIEPNTEFLSEVRPQDFYELLQKVMLRIKKEGKYEHIYIPTMTNEGNITSNRPSLVSVMTKRHQEAVTLKKPVFWNRKQSEILNAYPIKEVWEITDVAMEGEALNKNVTDVGGIDLNPNQFELESSGDTSQIKMNFSEEQLSTMPSQGFYPRIIQISPVTNLPFLLGVSKENNEQTMAAL
jgi:hypothetical protein